MSDKSKNVKTKDAPKAAGKDKSAAKAGQPAAKAAKPSRQHGPMLLETAITISQLGLVVTGASIFALSLQAGADLITSALRSGGAVLVVGLVMWLVNWWLARGSLEAVAAQMREAADAQPVNGSLDVNV